MRRPTIATYLIPSLCLPSSRFAFPLWAQVSTLAFGQVFDVAAFAKAVRPCRVHEMPTGGSATGSPQPLQQRRRRRQQQQQTQRHAQKHPPQHARAPQAVDSETELDVTWVTPRPIKGSWNHTSSLILAYIAARPSVMVQEIVETLEKEARRHAGPVRVAEALNTEALDAGSQSTFPAATPLHRIGTPST